MKIVLLHSDYQQDHLDRVIDDVKELGSPTIRVYDLGFDNLCQAIEGCHRLRACEILDIEPNIEVIDSDTRLEDLDGLDYDGCADTVSELGDWENYTVCF